MTDIKLDWFTKLSKELKGRTEADIAYEIDGLEPISALGQKVVNRGAIMPTYDPWLLGDIYEVSTGKEVEVNARMLRSLQNGADTLIVYVTSDDVNTSTLYDQINLDFIQQFVITDGQTSPISQDLSNTSIFGHNEDYYELTIGTKQSIVSNLSSWVEQLSDAKHILCRVKIGDDILLEIAKLRAMRLLFANYAKESDATCTIVADIGASLVDDKAVEDQYIAVTSRAFAAIAGTADVLAFTDFSQTLQTDARIMRNIGHLLRMESHLAANNDPLAGSYFVEDMTEKLAAAVWENVK